MPCLFSIFSFIVFISVVKKSKSTLNSSLEYDYAMGKIALYHSESTYCDPSTYLSRIYKGVLQGFVPTYSIYNKVHDTNGYIGYTPSQNSIYVAFRGSETIENWITDIDVITTSYPLCAGCYVHKGFYLAEQASISGIIDHVQLLQDLFPSYSVVVTGHSLGAALATYTAMDLQHAGVTGVRLFTFGSPRCGDTKFANWYSANMHDRNRITHHKDIVPHCPLHERFTHISGEWYEPDDTMPPFVNACSGNEDSSCSYQWSFTSVEDHLWYMGLTIGTDGCSVIL